MPIKVRLILDTWRYLLSQALFQIPPKTIPMFYIRHDSNDKYFDY